MTLDAGTLVALGLAAVTVIIWLVRLEGRVNGNAPGGLAYSCKECKRAYNRERYKCGDGGRSLHTGDYPNPHGRGS